MLQEVWFLVAPREPGLNIDSNEQLKELFESKSTDLELSRRQVAKGFDVNKILKVPGVEGYLYMIKVYMYLK